MHIIDTVCRSIWCAVIVIFAFTLIVRSVQGIFGMLNHRLH
jgi:hypothetical protein